MAVSRVFSSMFKSTSSKGNNNKPIQQPITVYSDKLACTIEGDIFLDIEGPLPYDILPKIIKKFAEYMIKTIIQLNSSCNGWLSYLYEQIRISLLHASPYPESVSGEQFTRLAISPTLKHYTSASCTAKMDNPLLIKFQNAWEIAGISDRPIIISCDVNIKIMTFSIIDRDKYRDDGFRPINIPSSRTEGKIKAWSKEIIQNFSNG